MSSEIDKTACSKAKKETEWLNPLRKNVRPLLCITAGRETGRMLGCSARIRKQQKLEELSTVLTCSNLLLLIPLTVLQHTMRAF